MNPILKSIINKQRRDFEQLSSGRSIPVKVLDGIREEHNICYKRDGDRAHMMDMYCPTTVKIPTPVVINVHGGGLIMGNKEFTGISASTSARWASLCFPWSTVCARR